MGERAAAVADAERIVAEEVQKHVRSEAERRAAPLIQEMRTRASAIAREEVERTLRRLGEDPELERRLDAMAGSIVSKLLHAPSTRLRQAVCDGGAGEALGGGGGGDLRALPRHPRTSRQRCLKCRRRACLSLPMRVLAMMAVSQRCPKRMNLFERLFKRLDSSIRARILLPTALLFALTMAAMVAGAVHLYSSDIERGRRERAQIFTEMVASRRVEHHALRPAERGAGAARDAPRAQQGAPRGEPRLAQRLRLRLHRASARRARCPGRNLQKFEQDDGRAVAERERARVRGRPADPERRRVRALPRQPQPP